MSLIFDIMARKKPQNYLESYEVHIKMDARTRASGSQGCT